MVPKEAGNKSPLKTTPSRKASLTPKTKSTPKSKTALSPKKTPKSKPTPSPKKNSKSKATPSSVRKTTPTSSKTQKPKPLTSTNKKTSPKPEKKRKNSPASSKATSVKGKAEKQLSVEEMKKFSGISLEHRSVIKFLTLKGITANQIYASMREVYTTKYPQFLAVQHWRRLFKAGRKTAMNDPKTAKTVSRRKTQQGRQPKKLQAENEKADVENHNEEAVAKEEEVNEQEKKDITSPELVAPKKAIKRRVENDQKAEAKKQANEGFGKIKIKLSGFLRHNKKIR